MSSETGSKKERSSDVESFGEQSYKESSRQLKQNGASIAISIFIAIIIWVFGNLAFLPISEGVTFFRWPMTEVVSFIILVALVIIILRVFLQIRGLTDGLGGVMAYELGKAAGEVRKEAYEHYRDALRGVLYVVVVILAYLLFSSYLVAIHPGLAAIVLIFIVIWSILSIWRVGKAISAEIGHATEDAAAKLKKE